MRDYAKVEETADIELTDNQLDPVVGGGSSDGGQNPVQMFQQIMRELTQGQG
jgi:hypothetical protein